MKLPVSFGSTFLIIYKYTIFLNFVHPLVTALTPAFITTASAIVSPAMPTTMVIVMAVLQAQPPSTIGLVIIVVVLFMMVFLVMPSTGMALATMTASLLPAI